MTISDQDKQPEHVQTLRRGDVLLVLSDPTGRIDTSPGQAFAGNGIWGPDGNGSPAPDDWHIPGAPQFAVVIDLPGDRGERYAAGARSLCIPYNGADGTMSMRLGLNVVQRGAASPLTNRWTGSIAVDVVIFR